jgi:hypothetical protein
MIILESSLFVVTFFAPCHTGANLDGSVAEALTITACLADF